MTTFVVIPTYNEVENLPVITSDLFELGIEDLQILIIDDNSSDGTGQVADDLAQRCYPGRFFVIHRQGKLGLGTAYVTGFTEAIKRGADYIIQMDADFSHSPSYVPQMLEIIRNPIQNTKHYYDVIVGSRYISGGELDRRWSWWRWLLSWWANVIWTRLILGVRTKDATAGFKCWRRSALQQIGLERITSNGYVFQVEMAYVSEKLNFHILEIPIYFEDRRIGRSKMTVPVKIEAALRVFEIRWRHHNVKPITLPKSTETL